MEEKSPLVSIQRIFIGKESFTQVSVLIMEQKSLCMFKVSPIVKSLATRLYSMNVRAGQFDIVTISSSYAFPVKSTYTLIILKLESISGWYYSLVSRVISLKSLPKKSFKSSLYFVHSKKVEVKNQ